MVAPCPCVSISLSDWDGLLWSGLWDLRCSGLSGARSWPLWSGGRKPPTPSWGSCCRQASSLHQEEKRAKRRRGPGFLCAASARRRAGVQVWWEGTLRYPLTRAPLSAQCGSVCSLLNDCFIVMWDHPAPGGVSVKATASLCGGAGVGLQSWPQLSAGTLFGSVLSGLGTFPDGLLV